MAMKHGTETLHGLYYKIQMMGVPISVSLYVYGENMSVINKTQRLESTLKKKNNSICYHGICEAVTMGELCTVHVQKHENISDFLT